MTNRQSQISSWTAQAMLVCAVLSNPATATSAETGRYSEDMYLEEVPVVLTASRLSQPVDEAPVAVTVIDRDMIRKSGAWDLSEVFRLVPGMFVSYHSSRFYATDSTVGYHGLLSDTMSRRMQVLLDGRSVYSPLFGGVIWSDIPVALDDIDHIEVIRGPDSASYGANSFMGVINIITRHAAEEQGKFVSLTTGRSRDEVIARYGGRSGDLTYRVTAGLRNDQGEDTFIRNPTSSEEIWTRNKFDDKKIRLFTLRADYRVNPTDELEFQLGYNGGPRQSGEWNDTVAQDKRADNHYEHLRWRRALNQGGELSVQFYHSVESSYTMQLDTSDPAAVPENGNVFAQRYDLEVQHTFMPTQNTRVVWGGSVRQDSAYAPYELETPDTLHFGLSQLFGNVEWRARPDLVFNLGAMAENNSYTGTDITPRIAANWHFLRGHTLRVSQSQATRTPSIYEKRYEEYYRATAYPNLKATTPERVNSTDIGYIGKFDHLDIDFRLFRDAFVDLVAGEKEAVRAGNLNSGEAVLKGFETQLKWEVAVGTRLIYSLSHAIVSSKDANKVPYTNSVPTNTQSMMLTHDFNKAWDASLMAYQVGEVHFRETGGGPGGSGLYFIGTHRRWDGRVAYNFHSGSTKGELALVVQNLGDAQYYEFRFDNQPPGRSTWLTLKLDL
jgi:iron complex outermembrane receptor protein